MFRAGLEPATQRFSVFCSNQLSYLNFFNILVRKYFLYRHFIYFSLFILVLTNLIGLVYYNSSATLFKGAPDPKGACLLPVGTFGTVVAVVLIGNRQAPLAKATISRKSFLIEERIFTIV